MILIVISFAFMDNIWEVVIIMMITTEGDAYFDIDLMLLISLLTILSAGLCGILLSKKLLVGKPTLFQSLLLQLLGYYNSHCYYRITVM